MPGCAFISALLRESARPTVCLRTLIAALCALGGWSAWRLREMGDVSRRIISNNYDSVIAAQEMKESLERQDSAALFALL
jgi:NtrC-family two-component system sensor histidine kinase KinB